MSMERRVARRWLESAEIPETVEERAGEFRDEQGYSESKAWAVSWSIYCCENPDSPHCEQNEYFGDEPAICEGIGDD